VTIVGAHLVFHRCLKASRKGEPEQFVPAVLLCKRTLDAPTEPGQWSLFGGMLHVKHGEDSKSAAIREVREELHVHLDAHDLEELCRVPAEDPVIVYYTYHLNWDLDRLTLQRSPEGKVEGEGIGWFSRAEVDHLAVRLNDRIAVADFFKNHAEKQALSDRRSIPSKLDITSSCGRLRPLGSPGPGEARFGVADRSAPAQEVHADGRGTSPVC
jgi:ADP-ribose pyrophosphatase YjhB (NUDIX family)